MHRALPVFGTVALLLAACSGDGGSSPTAIDAGDTLTLTSASLSINGQPLQTGDSVHHNHDGAAGATRFEATLMSPLGPAPGHRVEVSFERPGGMMHSAGSFHLYDDGTHGDRIAGDGVYCFEDSEGAYGLHHMEAHHGQYDYDFCGFHPDGRETNHWAFHVTVVD